MENIFQTVMIILDRELIFELQLENFYWECAFV